MPFYVIYIILDTAQYAALTNIKKPMDVKNKKIYLYINGERKIKRFLPLIARKSYPKTAALTDKYIINSIVISSKINN